MKRNAKVLLSALAIVLLTGCSGAQANIKSSETIMTIGSKSYTSQDEFDCIKKANGGTLTLELCKEAVYDEVIGRGDDIVKEAKDSYKESAEGNDQIEDQIKKIGYADADDYINTVLVPEAQAKHLTEEYFKDNEEAIIKEYKPSVVTILQCDDAKTAEEALKALKEGESLKNVFKKYSTKDSMYRNTDTILTTLKTDIPSRIVNSSFAADEGVVDEVFTEDGFTYAYVVVKKNSSFKDNFDQFMDEIITGSDFDKEMWVYYFTKYDIKIYDQTIFDFLKQKNPEFLLDHPELSEKDD